MSLLFEILQYTANKLSLFNKIEIVAVNRRLKLRVVRVKEVVHQTFCGGNNGTV